VKSSNWPDAPRRRLRSVLILGETGTGKELLAQAIHAASPRANAPFVAVNIAAVPETLLEAEFFGVAAGAYTGADKRGRDGKFKLADGGTLFLDEIGDMSLALQAKLLRTLQEREVEPVGSNRLISVDVRIIAATSRNLEKMVSAGEFRADLYYRLNVITLKTPPLRARVEDLPILAEYLLEHICRQQGVPLRGISAGAIDAWPAMTGRATCANWRMCWSGHCWFPTTIVCRRRILTA
jgi:transcriptional regulator with PAS, ATPase and Fis domain